MSKLSSDRLFVTSRFLELGSHSCTLLFFVQEQELKKQQAYEEFLKEKLMIDEIVRKIYEEDRRYVFY